MLDSGRLRCQASSRRRDESGAPAEISFCEEPTLQPSERAARVSRGEVSPALRRSNGRSEGNGMTFRFPATCSCRRKFERCGSHSKFGYRAVAELDDDRVQLRHRFARVPWSPFGRSFAARAHLAPSTPTTTPTTTTAAAHCRTEALFPHVVRGSRPSAERTPRPGLARRVRARLVATAAAEFTREIASRAGARHAFALTALLSLG